MQRVISEVRFPIGASAEFTLSVPASAQSIYAFASPVIGYGSVAFVFDPVDLENSVMKNMQFLLVESGMVINSSGEAGMRLIAPLITGDGKHFFLFELVGIDGGN